MSCSRCNKALQRFIPDAGRRPECDDGPRGAACHEVLLSPPPSALTRSCHAVVATKPSSASFPMAGCRSEQPSEAGPSHSARLLAAPLMVGEAGVPLASQTGEVGVQGLNTSREGVPTIPPADGRDLLVGLEVPYNGGSAGEQSRVLGSLI